MKKREYLLLARNKTKIISSIKTFSKPFSILTISLILLISIISLKTFKTKVGYKLTKSNLTRTKTLLENQRLRSEALYLKSHKRIESIARNNGMKFPNQQDLIKINNE